MNNKIKLIVTDDASEFTQEILISYKVRIFPLFSAQKTEKNCAIKLKEKALMLY